MINGAGLIGLILAVAFMLMTVTWGKLSRLAELQDNGIVTDAEVDRFWREDEYGETEYMLSYRFRAHFQTFTAEEVVSAELFQETADDLVVRIRYDPEDPTFARMVEGPDDTVIALDGRYSLGQIIDVLTLSICGLAFLIPAISILLPWPTRSPLIRLRLSERSLRQDGQLLPGEIAIVERVETKPGKFGDRLYYVFVAPDGSVLSGVTAPITAPVGYVEATFLPGTKVAVIYAHHDLHTLL